MDLRQALMTDERQREDIALAKFRKKPVSTTGVAIAIDEVRTWSGTRSSWCDVREAVRYFQNDKRRDVTGVIKESTCTLLPTDIREALHDIVKAPDGMCNETLLRVAGQGEELLPVLMNTTLREGPASRILLARPELQIKFTFSSRGQFLPLSDIDDDIAARPLDGASAPTGSIAAAAPVHEAPGQMHLLRLAVADYDGQELASDGLSLEVGYLAVQTGAPLLVRSPPWPCHGRNQYQSPYVFASLNEMPEQEGWVPEVILGSYPAEVPTSHEIQVLKKFDDTRNQLRQVEAVISIAENHLDQVDTKLLAEASERLDKLQDEGIDSVTLSGLSISLERVARLREQRKELADQAVDLHARVSALFEQIDKRTHPRKLRHVDTAAHPAHISTAPLEEYDIASDAGDDMPESSPESNVQWREYEGRWWRVEPNGTWRALNGSTWTPRWTSDAASVEEAYFHVPNLGFGEFSNARCHFDALRDELSKHQVRILDKKFGIRPMCDIPQILGSIPEEDHEVPADVAPYYLVWLQVCGPPASLSDLRSGKISVELQQPEGSPLKIKFLPYRKPDKTERGKSRRVAMPRKPSSSSFTDDTSTSMSSSSSFLDSSEFNWYSAQTSHLSRTQ